MTTDPIPPVCFPVAPVTDYEPPAHAAAPGRPTRSGSSVRPRRGHPPRMRPDRPPRSELSPLLHSAAVFADAALRRVLEIVDGRRPPAHLLPLLATGLAESVLSARRTPAAGRAGPATLVRVRVRPAGPGEPGAAVEAFGTYRRGPRTHALACRIERVSGMGPDIDWRIVALHIG